MKQLRVTNSGMIEMSRDELKDVKGGGLSSLLLGTTLFGMARTIGMLIGCL